MRGRRGDAFHRRAILDVPGLGGIFIGPSDLGLALGLGPDPLAAARELAPIVADIVARAHRADRLAGIYFANRAQAEAITAPFDLVAFASDLGLVAEASRTVLTTLRSTFPTQDIPSKDIP